MPPEETKIVAQAYGQPCTYERLVRPGSQEHYIFQETNAIPYGSISSEWVETKENVYSETIARCERGVVRNFKLA